MENNKKTSNGKVAMTLAEILIVVVIIAIIGCVLLAIPRKNVSAMDRTKYYIAYMTLQRLLNEQVADNGKIALKTSTGVETCTTEDDSCNELKEKFDTASGHSFGTMVDKWLNVVKLNSTNATLSNGLYLDWSGREKTENGITVEKDVWFDIDGPNEGRSLDQKDKHYFRLSRNEHNGEIRVRPIAEEGPQGTGNNGVPDSNATWITFKVFKVGNNGSTKIQLLDQNYTKAYDCYDDYNGASSSISSAANNACSRKCKDEDCFIEPISPLK